MSKKIPHTETPPPSGSNLVEDFQVLRRSPEFFSALRRSPLAQTLLQQMAPNPPAQNSPLTDYETSLHCMATHVSHSPADLVQTLPGTASTWQYCKLTSQSPGCLSPTHFTSWFPAPPETVSPSNSELAASKFAEFQRLLPWSTCAKDTPSTDPLWPVLVQQASVLQPNSPTPLTSEDAVESTPFILFTHAMQVLVPKTQGDMVYYTL